MVSQLKLAFWMLVAACGHGTNLCPMSASDKRNFQGVCKRELYASAFSFPARKSDVGGGGISSQATPCLVPGPLGDQSHATPLGHLPMWTYM